MQRGLQGGKEQAGTWDWQAFTWVVSFISALFVILLLFERIIASKRRKQISKSGPSGFLSFCG